jgi:L-ascorbate metabolism protein UlaG (beta-lactamase superfamily)
MKRRKFLKLSLTTAGVILSDKSVFAEGRSQILTSRISNPALKTILSDWQGTPLDQDGRFMNHEFPFIHKFSAVWKWKFKSNPQKQEKKNDTWQLEVIKNDDFLQSKEDLIVWLGHASFYVQIDGIKILIDPILGKIPVVKRLTEFPFPPEKLTDIDYILVSHAHYDHCSKDSIKQLAKQNPKAQFLTGLNLNKLLEKWTQRSVQGAGWFQQFEMDKNIQICYIPSRHWSNRSVGDANKTLWGGFVIKTQNKTVFFGGDSGFGSHFKQVGEIFSGIDVAMIGAGSYSPRWFMEHNHQDPQNAVRAFNEMKAKVMIPFHYGTFDQTDEPISESEKELLKLQKEGKIEQRLAILKIGEVFKIV